MSSKRVHLEKSISDIFNFFFLRALLSSKNIKNSVSIAGKTQNNHPFLDKTKNFLLKLNQ